VTIDYSPGAVGREQRVTNEMVRSRYRSVDADHAIVVLTGNTSRPGIVDSFCVHHAGRGVDVWKLDTRFSPNGWSDDVADWGARIAQTTRLPLFMVGSARSAADVYRALDISDVFVGAVVILDATRHCGRTPSRSPSSSGKAISTLGPRSPGLRPPRTDPSNGTPYATTSTG
jgi:hypothetical protein